MHLIHFALLAGVAFLAALVAGVTGFGGAAILLPALVLAYGTRDAIGVYPCAVGGQRQPGVV